MHCNQVKQYLEQALTRAEAEANPALMAHLQACEACRTCAQQQWETDEQLRRLMAADDIPPMRAGFADQALARAWEKAEVQRQRKSTRPYIWGAAAASLLLVMLGGHWLTTSEPSATPQVASQGAETPSVVMAPAITREVQVRLVSKEALADASITLQLEGDLALNGYPGTTTLQWRAGLAAGINQLALPLSLSSATSQGGTVTVRVAVGEASKSFSFRVQAQALAMQGLTQVYLASL